MSHTGGTDLAQEPSYSTLIQLVSEPGLAGIEVVECAPPYDWAEQTALLSSRVILDSLAAQIGSGKLGRKPAALRRHARGP